MGLPRQMGRGAKVPELVSTDVPSRLMLTALLDHDKERTGRKKQKGGGGSGGFIRTRT